MLARARLSLVALALALVACGDGDPDVVVTDTTTVVEAPALDATEPTEADLDAAPPEESAVAEDTPTPATQPTPDPVPAAGPPEEGEQSLSAVSDGMLGVSNETGRTLVALHIAGCGESEGNDWDTMETWTTDYLGTDFLEAGEATMIDLVPGCYVIKSMLDDGASMQEEIQTTAGMIYEVEIDV